MKKLGNKPIILKHLVGQSPVFLNAIRRMEKIAKFSVPVFIYGETGTGKDVFARTIHNSSDRCGQPFVALNCGSIPDSLIENELFGHIKGAYTDAQSSSEGVLARAHGGSLFLDEIDSLSHKGQVSLLRFIQDKEFSPLGTSQAYYSDVRIITATNTNILQKINNAEFRQDLFFRLNIMNLEIPALRNRATDVELLANYFINKFCKAYALPDMAIHRSSIAHLYRYKWPGNVRELENVLLREILLTDSTTLYLNDLDTQFSNKNNGLPPDAPLYELEFSTAKAKIVANFEKHYLDNLMKKTSGNVTRAAKLAGTERRAFGKLLKKNGINRVYYAVDNC